MPLLHPSGAFRALLASLGLCALALGPVRAAVPLRQVVDEQLTAAWKDKKVSPASLADDATFLRRLYLDLVGTIPTHDEAAAFLADASAGKRDQLIAKLLLDDAIEVANAIL